LEDLYEYFKFNLGCYNILEIKNALIIKIGLSLSKIMFFQKMLKISPLLYIFFTHRHSKSSLLLLSKLPNKTLVVMYN